MMSEPSSDVPVAFDGRMAEHTGVGRYIRNLVRAFAQGEHEFRMRLLVNPDQGCGFIGDSDRVEVVRLRRRTGIYSPSEHLAMPGEISRSGARLIHFPHFAGPWRCPLPRVVTIHDLTYIHFPSVAPSWLGARYASAMLRRAARDARVIITASRHAATDIVTLLGVPEEKVLVVPHSVADFEALAAGIPADTNPPPPLDELPGYVLYVGNHLPHKNLHRLVAALAEVHKDRPDEHLMLAGKPGRNTDALKAQIERRGLTACVHVTGAVSDEELVALYRHASVLVLPSLMEGFGLTLLEAFACGVPVVASNRGPLPEVAGDAALLVDPESTEEIAGAISSILSSEEKRQKLVECGRKRLPSFSPARLLEGTLGAYRAALKGE